MRTKKWLLTCGVVAVIAIVTAAIVVLRGRPGGAPAGDGVAAAVGQYLRAWSAGDDRQAGALTDDPRGAGTVLAASRSGLGASAVTATLQDVSGDTARVRVEWTLSQGGVWTYDTALTVVPGDGAPRVHFTPAAIHPELGEGDRMVTRSAATGVALVDRDGAPLLRWGTSGPEAVEPSLAPLILPGLGRLLAIDSTAWTVSRVDRQGREEVLHRAGQPPAAPMRTTLSRTVQRAAQAAVDGAPGPAMLVVIQPSTGDILAVAQNAQVTDGNPLTGLYAPGSTFKIATVTAALERGLARADEQLPCPATVRIGQRTIPNEDLFAFPSLPLHSAFAHSCNTTFAQLASRLPADGLAEAAGRLGLNADFTIPGITTEAGKVVPATGSADQVESAIGQGSVQASPFGLALMAATVAAGEPVTPQLVRDRPTTVNEGYTAPSRNVITELRTMMREVVTGGTATGLRASGTVHGKTGTAQYGDGSQANGWFVGYRGDVAFSALTLATNSSKPAVALSAAFLNRLP
ncbi:penicillin-binding transpeptidase domain-containing protein [Amycolatopsis sp. NPDC006131]|uniref:penicillin-binding transpeptidase domain-containing protein n=1 Tax=Amycolatopsis sp. NPDC006131 TaxID=3156731 RepID=UPI0033BCA446